MHCAVDSAENGGQRVTLEEKCHSLQIQDYGAVDSGENRGQRVTLEEKCHSLQI